MPPATSEVRAGARPWGLWSALAAYVLLRALVLHTAFDEVALWMYELYPMGTLAELVGRGIPIPLDLYYDNAAGQIFSGLASVPFFALLGPSYLALKMLPFLLGVGTLLLAWKMLDASFGRRTADVAAWLLALAPTCYLKYSLVCSGNHFENVFFTTLFLFAALRVQLGGPSPARLFACGAAAGFALFVFLGALLPVGIVLAVQGLLAGLRGCARQLAWTLAGLALGLAPLVLLNLQTHGRALGFLDAKFGEPGESAGLATLLERVGQYLGPGLLQAPGYPEAPWLPASAAGWILAVALLAAWLALAPLFWRACAARAHAAPAERAQGLLLGVLFLYLPLSALAFGVSNFRLGGYAGPLAFGGYRYYLPLFLFGMLGVAVLAGARAAQAPGGGLRRGLGVLLAACVLLPGLSNLRLVDTSGRRTGLGLRYQGYDLSKLARALLAARNGLTHEQRLEYLERFPPPLRARIVEALAFNLGVLQIETRRAAAPEAWWVDLAELVRNHPERDHAALARGAGIAARFTQAMSGAGLEQLAGVLQRTLEHAGEQREALGARFLEGAAAQTPTLPLSEQVPGITATTNGLIGTLAGPSDELARDLARGQGLLAGKLVRRGIPADLELLRARRAELAADLQAEFARGLGMGCAVGGEAPGLARGFALPSAEQAAFWQGFAAELVRVHGSGARAAAQAVLDELPAEERALLERQLP